MTEIPIYLYVLSILQVREPLSYNSINSTHDSTALILYQHSTWGALQVDLNVCEIGGVFPFQRVVAPAFLHCYSEVHNTHLGVSPRYCVVAA